MTMPTRIERNLPAILEDLSMAPVPDYLDDVFGQTGATVGDRVEGLHHFDESDRLA